MRFKTALGIVLLVVLSLVTWVGNAHAQVSPIIAEVDKTSLAIEDTLELTVTLTGPGELPSPTLPTFEGIVIISETSLSQVSIAQGQIQSEITYRYTMRPTRPGDLSIGAISVAIGEETYTTEPIALTVTGEAASFEIPNNEGPPKTLLEKLAGNEYYVEGEINNLNPFLGEQVVYTFRFYRTTEPSGPPSFDAPAFTGFLNTQAFSRDEFFVIAAGRRYEVVEQRTVIFPTLYGTLQIEPAYLAVPNNNSGESLILQTDPLELTVARLPLNVPDDFNGAVGSFEIKAEAESQVGEVSQPLNLRVTIEGQGNIETLPDPVWPEIPQLRGFTNNDTTSTRLNDEGFSGSRVYERLLIPEALGEFTYPRLSYTFFDPSKNDFRTVSTEPIQLTIEPGNTESTSIYATINIQNIRTVPPTLASSQPALVRTSFYWGAWGLPLLLTLGAVAWRARTARAARLAATARSQNARRDARRALGQAKRNGTDAYNIVDYVLLDYLDRKLNQPVRGMTRTRLAEFLVEHEISPESSQRVVACLTASENGRFSQNHNENESSNALYDDAELLINDIEKELTT